MQGDWISVGALIVAIAAFSLSLITYCRSEFQKRLNKTTDLINKLWSARIVCERLLLELMELERFEKKRGLQGQDSDSGELSFEELIARGKEFDAGYDPLIAMIATSGTKMSSDDLERALQGAISEYMDFKRLLEKARRTRQAFPSQDPK